ncbi:ATP-binding protein [Pseudonocardia sichuanensis]
MSFLNRVDELGQLRARIDGRTAELLVVYGRRRIGKTELLTNLAAEVRSLYVEATDSVPADQLRDLGTELARISGDQLLANQPLTNWPAALAAIGRFAGDERTLVVLDEFQLLATRSPELETVLSQWWRTTGRGLPIVLVLAGSELSFFEDKVLAGQLYGRRTGQLRLEPFTPRDAGLFQPGYSPEDRIRTFAVCGGVPYYLDRFRDDRPLAANLLTEVFQRTGLLHDEAELMLRQSIPDPANHIAVLRSIAHGHNRNNQISQRTGLAPAHVTKLLDALERLGLVERLRPITASAKARKTAYAISDQFLRFHYRFVEPARSQLRTTELASRYLESTVVPQLDAFTSRIWEEIAQQHVLATVPGVNAVGRWWGSVPTGDGRRTEEREIDVVGVDGARRVVVLGTCKWTARPAGIAELNLLDHLAPFTGAQAPRRLVFSRSGFDEALTARAAQDPSVTLVSPADIYA